MECPLALGAGHDKHCFLCDKPLTGRRTRWCSALCVKLWYQNHNWTGARKAAKKRDKYRCVKCGSNYKLEVNHILPLVGRGYAWGCLNHLAGIETLCHDCHVRETNRQRRERLNVLS